MKLLAMFLLAAPLAFAQFGQPQIPGTGPRGNNPTGVPDPNAPADTKPQKQHHSSNKDVQEKLHKLLDSKNVAYKGSNITPTVDNQNVTLTGSVTSSMQHDMAMQIARAFGEDRQVVDKLVIQ